MSWALLLLACKVTVEPPVPVPDDDPTEAWDALLKQAVTDDGYVDYDRIERDRDVLERFVAWTSTGRLPRNSQGAYVYWVNAYNAWVIYGVLLDGRPASVHDVDLPGPWPGIAFYSQRQFRSGPDRQSLADVLHERLRTRRQDVRVHAAVNGGIRSGPPMHDGVYHFDGFDRELDAQMARWVNDPIRGVRVQDGVAVVNPVFTEYPRDFWYFTGGEDLCTVLAAYATAELGEALRGLSRVGCPTRAYAADLSLNDVR